MKIKYILSIAVLSILAGCKKDNYDAPGLRLNGRVVYQGEAINVEQPFENPANIELWQPGFGKLAAIPMPIAQDGSYSQELFAGNYKLTMQPGNGPWMWRTNAAGKPDTVFLDFKGNQTLDLEVTPYYLIHNFTNAVKGRNIIANFKADKIITDANAKDIEYVNLYVNKTQFVSGGYNIASRRYNNDAIIDPSNVTFNKFIPTLSPTQDYVYARIGLKIAGVDKLVFSPVQKVQLQPIANYQRIQAETGTLVNAITDDKNTYVQGMTTVGSSVTLTFTAPAAGNYMVNVVGASDIAGTTQTITIDGVAKKVVYPKQGATDFDIVPIEFTLTAGAHTVVISKTATDPGAAQLDYVDFFTY
ncbi:hypothetical protein GCM10023149_00280 [Mucilaginibacter gynuensis]|uniref:CBM6 domain-containing protein n=1 Tax=Mucilaginibacter gynuensis TaxID=1302236 RepID=A0ABP8FLT8_9SPHI